jgi:DNA polymerase V
MFALVDCNAFFVSCEKVFQPHLEGKPVVVLSSNDGCVISRSQEAKALGIKMGEPLFTIKDKVKQHNIKVFSSNFSLYRDMSRRVMATLQAHSSALEVYSVDEAFLDLRQLTPQDLFSHGCFIKSIVKQWTGIPVSVGIAPTKTLAKVANHFAKHNTSGCFVLTDLQENESILKDFPLSEVWGIGSQWAKKLSAHSLHTGLDLAKADINWLKKAFNVVLARTALELRGTSCLKLEEIYPPKKSMISSRSFGSPVTSLDVLSEAVSSHASRLAHNLRQQKSKAALIRVTIRTSPFHHREDFYTNSYIVPLPSPSQDSSVLISAARKGLEKIFRDKLRYKKAAVMVLDLCPEDQATSSLFDTQTTEYSAKRKQLLKVFDDLNHQHGKRAVLFASEGVRKSWSPSSLWKSRAYTTSWNELLEVG